MVGASKATAAWFPLSERGMATAMFDGATKLANMVAFPVLAFVMSEWGWRAGFLFTSVISVLFTAVWWWGYRDPSTARSLRPAEREFILEGGARDIDRGGARQFRSALRSGRIWLLSCGFACYGYTINIVLTWMPEFLQREFHVRLLQSGIYSMIPWAVATVAELLVGGWLVDRLVRRGRNPWTVRKTVLTCGLALGATIGAAGSAGSPAVAVVWMSLSLAGLAIAAPVAWGLPGLLAPPGTVGAVSGLMNFLNTAATARRRPAHRLAGPGDRIVPRTVPLRGRRTGRRDRALLAGAAPGRAAGLRPGAETAPGLSPRSVAWCKDNAPA